MRALRGKPKKLALFVAKHQVRGDARHASPTRYGTTEYISVQFIIICHSLYEHRRTILELIKFITEQNAIQIQTAKYF